MIIDSRPVIFGEVLFDVFPDGEHVLGGAPFNVAWHLHAFGANPLMITSIGDDDSGNSILESMQSCGMDTTAVDIDRKRPTGMVKVTIDNDEPIYDIVDESAWDYINPLEEVSLKDCVLYHGTLALRHQSSEQALKQLKQSGSLIFIDVNLRPPWYDIKTVNELIRKADWLKLNTAELQEVVPAYTAAEDQLAFLHEQMEIENIILTSGESGAALSQPTGINLSIKPESSIRIVDTVGAGDAFSSIMLLGIMHQWPIEITFERAQAFASAIVGQRGATVADKSFYANIVDSWQ